MWSSFAYFYTFASDWSPKDIPFRAVDAFMYVWSYAKSLWTEYLTNRLGEFFKICNLGAVGDNDGTNYILRSEGQGQGYDETKCGQKSLVKNARFQRRQLVNGLLW